jgi:acyl carrier protein
MTKDGRMIRKTSADVESLVYHWIEDLTGRRREDVHPEHRLLKDLKMDSDDFGFEFVPEIERALGVKTVQTDWETVETVQEAIDVFVRRLPNQRNMAK